MTRIRPLSLDEHYRLAPRVRLLEKGLRDVLVEVILRDPPPLSHQRRAGSLLEKLISKLDDCYFEAGGDLPSPYYGDDLCEIAFPIHTNVIAYLKELEYQSSDLLDRLIGRVSGPKVWDIASRMQEQLSLMAGNFEMQLWKPHYRAEVYSGLEEWRENFTSLESEKALRGGAAVFAAHKEYSYCPTEWYANDYR